MKKLLSLIFTISLTISACGTAQTQSAPPAQTSTQTLTPTETQTPNPPTATTPLPTIPTFTPTFDISTIVTVTPAEKAECLKEDQNLVPTFYVPKHPGCFDADHCVFSGTEKEILEFLNKGATVQSVISRLQTAIDGNYQEYAYQDVTGDNIPDLMFIDFSVMGRLHIFLCSEGSYRVFSSELNLEYTAVNQKIIVEDLNLDEIQEVLFLQGYGNNCCNIHTLGWNGQTFDDLSLNAETDNAGISIKDIDQNGIQEIVGTGIGSLSGFYRIPDLSSFDANIPPLRTLNRVYSWDGRNFVFSSEEFEHRQYRFQTIQEADHQALHGNYDEAMILDQDAISSDKLDWWSQARFGYYKAIVFGTALPSPILDSSEYPTLTAYAYYRIMLLHLAQGQETEAASTYQTLQETFGTDPYAKPYIEMATAFWESYQSTQRMYDGCAAAIQYAVEHPKILIPLGSDYHGWQSHIYEPADVCPFR